MRDQVETVEENLDPSSLDCLQRTRSGVLNVLVVVGLFVAVSGALLRGRGGAGVPAVIDRQSRPFLECLLVIFVVSTFARRLLGLRSRLRDPQQRASRYYWAHVIPAILGGLAAPLGLFHGIVVSGRLEAILPFWITALVLGVLAYPRGRELEGLGAPMACPRKLS
jgi:hypothetical protein